MKPVSEEEIFEGGLKCYSNTASSHNLSSLHGMTAHGSSYSCYPMKPVRDRLHEHSKGPSNIPRLLSMRLKTSPVSPPLTPVKAVKDGWSASTNATTGWFCTASAIPVHPNMVTCSYIAMLQGAPGTVEALRLGRLGDDWEAEESLLWEGKELTLLLALLLALLLLVLAWSVVNGWVISRGMRGFQS